MADLEVQHSLGVSHHAAVGRSVMALLTLALLAGGYLAYIRLFPPVSQSTPIPIYLTPLHFTEEGLVFDKGASAIPELLSLQAQAKTSDEMMAAKYHLGIAYLDATSTFYQGVDSLKSLSADDSAPAFYRTAAIEKLVVLDMATSSDFALKHLFTGSVWGPLGDENDTIFHANLAALEWAESLFPTMKVEYRIALFLADELTGTTDIGKRADLVKQVSDMLAKGDVKYGAIAQLVDSRIASGQPLPVGIQSSLGLGLVLKARTLVLLKQAGEYGGDSSAVIDIYKSSIKYLETPGNTGDDLGNGLWSRYYLGLYLATYGTKEEQKDIQSVLAPLVAASKNPALSDANVFYVLRSLAGQSSAQNPIIARIQKMGTLDPTFKNLLVSFGWE